jgi:hypothetical protein
MPMNQDEITRYLDVSLVHSITIDVREVDEAPGWLRTVTIYDDYSVDIEFQKCSEYLSGEGEGGWLKYVGNYENLENCVSDLVEFLGMPMSSWLNFTLHVYAPAVVEELDSTKNIEYFESLVRDKRATLPLHGRFRLAGIYWRHIELFGEYRPDRLGEETDILLKEQGLSDEESDEWA